MVDSDITQTALDAVRGLDRIDVIIRHESELGAYDLESVRDMYKGAI